MMLFDEPSAFEGLPESGFEVFSIDNRDRRRRAIIEAFHPSLTALGEDLLRHLEPAKSEPLHAHLPRLDWPRGYQPFCTWLALSKAAQGYQSGPQLNVGVHADHVTIRLGWDASSVEFGRFEFLGRHGALHGRLLEAAATAGLRFAVYASAPWPEGSRRVFDSPDDLDGSFRQVQRRGVWWEIGRRLELAEHRDCICTPALGPETLRIFRHLLPIYLDLA